MKLKPLFTAIAVIFSLGLSAQVCNPNSNITVEGLTMLNDSVPCIVQGQPYSAFAGFKNYSSFVLNGNPITIDSIRIDTISNLPCGITWEASKASRTYYPGELGCIALSGTTTDAPGQYKANVALTCYVGGSPIQYNASGFDNVNILRVKATSGSSCPIVDTTSSATNLTPSCITPQPAYGPNFTCNGLAVTITGANPACQGTSATLTANATYGSSSVYDYTWSTGENVQTISFPAAQGTYSVTVYDGNCTVSSSFNLSVGNCNLCNPNSNVSVPSLPTADDSTPCVVQGQAYYTAISFRNFATFNLSGAPISIDSVSIDTVSNLPCGLTWSANKQSLTYGPSEIGCITFSGTTTDAVGQYKINMAIRAFIGGTAISYNGIGLGYNGILRVKASAGANCPAVDTSSATNHLTASCATPPPVFASGTVVWPGDANSDGIVDANDALQIATAFGSIGPIRTNASLSWVAQPATNWTTFTYGINDKYPDGDGNGVVNADDTLAVSQNYSLTHPKTEGQKAQASDPVISFVAVTDTLRANQSFHIKVMLGDAATPIDSLNGIAFSMNLDPNIFDTTGAQFLMGTSWMGNGSNAFSFRKAVPAAGKIDMVLAKTNHQNASGYGQIGELVLKTQAHVYTNATTLNLTPTVIKGITANGTTKTYNTQSTTVSITGIEEATIAQYITLYPNPSNGHFTLTVAQPSKTLNIQLLNIQGQQLYTEQLKDQSHYTKDFNLSDLAKGVYLLKVSTENGVAVKRVVVE